MSSTTHTVLVGFIDLLLLFWLSGAASYECTGSFCRCLSSNCHTNCTDGFCQNKEFVCTQDVNQCSFECQEAASCQNSTFYVSATDFYINCNGSNSCDDIAIHCGTQRQSEPLRFGLNEKDFINNNMRTCGISASSSSMHNSYISCNGNIKNCYIDSAEHANDTVSHSEFDCSIEEGQCALNCDSECIDSKYFCDALYVDQCECNGCGQGVIAEILSSERPIIASTTPYLSIDVDTNNEDISKQSIFDLTDGDITNLDILYYFIIGAGTCLFCCICLCVSLIFVLRSTIKRKKRENNVGNPTISKSRSSDISSKEYMSNDSAIEMTLSELNKMKKMTKNDNVSSMDTNSSHIFEEEDDDKNNVSSLDDSSFHKMDDIVNGPEHSINDEMQNEQPQNIKITLTEYTKKAAQNEKGKEMKENELNFEENGNGIHLAPTSRSSNFKLNSANLAHSPSSTLSAISMSVSNPDPIEGTGIKTMSLHLVEDEKNEDSEESEMNLQCHSESEHKKECEEPTKMNQMMADYVSMARSRNDTHSKSQSRTKSHFVAYLENNQNIPNPQHYINQSMQSTPLSLPVIHSNDVDDEINNNEDNKIMLHHNPQRLKLKKVKNRHQHQYTSSTLTTQSFGTSVTATSATSATSASSSSCSGSSISSSSSDSDSSCSCSECEKIHIHKKRDSKLSSVASPIASTVNGNDNDYGTETMCSCKHCAATSCLSGSTSSCSSSSSSSESDSTASSSDTASSSSSSSESSSSADSERSGTITSSRSGRKPNKKKKEMAMNNKAIRELFDDDSTMSGMSSVGNKRYHHNNKTFVVHGHHSSQNTMNSNISNMYSTPIGGHEHGRFKSLKANEINNYHE